MEPSTLGEAKQMGRDRILSCLLTSVATGPVILENSAVMAVMGTNLGGDRREAIEKEVGHEERLLSGPLFLMYYRGYKDCCV